MIIFLSSCPLRWAGSASGPITFLHLPSGAPRASSSCQRQQWHHGELWPRPGRPGAVQRSGTGGVRPAAASLLRRGAETSADDQEGPQDAGPRWAEGTTSPTIHFCPAYKPLTCCLICFGKVWYKHASKWSSDKIKKNLFVILKTGEMFKTF